jgi:hypothetical protein
MSRNREAEEAATALYAEFVAELSELSRKYKIWIGGCGCCQSPFVESEGSEHMSEPEDTPVQYSLDAEEYVLSPELCRIRLCRQTPFDIEMEKRTVWDDEEDV